MKNICKSKSSSLKKVSGFTLIELLIVIAVLGVLAAVVLVAINPLEQLARGRDAGRKNAIGQLGSAVEAYYTAHSASYPLSAGNAFESTLQTSGELKVMPTNLQYLATASVGCANSSQNGYCYLRSATDAIVYASLESNAERSKCGAVTAWYVWASTNGGAGIYCNNSDPVLAPLVFVQ